MRRSYIAWRKTRRYLRVPAGESGGGGEVTVSSVSRSVVDIEGGGAALRVIGSGFDDGAAVRIGGVLATTTFISSTDLDAIPGPRAAGTALDVVVTNPDTSEGTLEGVVTYLDIENDLGASGLWEAPDYDEATDTWTGRVGGNLTASGNAPTEVSNDGEPHFDGVDQWLSSATELDDFVTASAGTIFIVFDPTDMPVADEATPYTNRAVVCNAGNGTIGVWAASFGGVPSMGGQLYDGADYRVPHVPLGPGAYQACCLRWSDSAVEISVDGGASWDSVELDGPWTFTPGALNVGRAFAGGNYAAGGLRVLSFFPSRLDDGEVSQLFRWSQQRHGVQ